MSNEVMEVQVQVDNNPFALTGRREASGQIEANVQIASSRQAQEVQAAMVIAKKFPRNEAEAYARIMQACKRKGLAEVAQYSFPRGGVTVSGPSIRLAETLARSWGNLDFGVVELEKRDGESTVMAFCWDLETNTRQTKIFQVSHEIEKKGGVKKMLTDPRDISEMIANQGARRVRGCILGLIPGDIVEAAVEQCDKTLEGDNKVPLVDRVRKMALVFHEEFTVSTAMIEKRLGHKLDATSEQELVGLRKIYVSLRDGMSNRDQWFEAVVPVVPVSPAAPAEVPHEVLGAKKEKAKGKAKEPQPPEPAPHADPDTLIKPADPAKPKTRMELLAEIREVLQATGLPEPMLLGMLYERGILVEGSVLTAVPADVLAEVITILPGIIEAL